MDDYQKILGILFAIVVTISLLIMPSILYYGNKARKLEIKIKKLGDTIKISKTLNIIWAIMFIPSIITSFYAIVGIAMGGEAALGWASSFQITCLVISICLFWAKPICIIGSVLISFIYRKKEKSILSVLIQFTPIATLLCASLFSLAVLWIGWLIVLFTCAFLFAFSILFLVAFKIIKDKKTS